MSTNHRSTTPPRTLNSAARITFLAASLLSCLVCSSRAGSATWNQKPGSSDWNTATNWTPATVPNGSSDIATFDKSKVTSIALSSGDIFLDSIVFDPGASPFTIDTGSGVLVLEGAGVINNSGIDQQFFVDLFDLFFWNQSSAGTQNTYTVNGGSGGSGILAFTGQATAGSSTFIVQGAQPGQEQGGILTFFEGTPSADHGRFLIEGAAIRASGGLCEFENSATAGHGAFEIAGGKASGAAGGFLVFEDRTSAEGATITCRGGIAKAYGGSVSFSDGSRGERVVITLFGNSALEIADHNPPGTAVGALAGFGVVTLGANTLSVGNKNLDTTFAGVLQDGAGSSGGGLTKIGKATLTLSGASTYTGPTTIESGGLIVTNTCGSATGTGPVTVAGGVLGGGGIVAGSVNVGSSSGPAALAPGVDGAAQTLTIQSSLTFGALATYQVNLDSASQTGDEVVADGVTIASGAQIGLTDLGAAKLPSGTAFTLIKNTAGTGITGTFRNLPDGSKVTAGTNTYRVSYEGGVGNDLTLTVQ